MIDDMKSSVAATRSVHLATGSWSLLMQSQTSNGAWSTFASYTLTRSDRQ